jgi:hypothetical protein
MARIGDKKEFCVLEFAKTEPIVMGQQRFQTKYHTEPPMDKTIHEWYKKFQPERCETNRPAGAIGQDVERV